MFAQPLLPHAGGGLRRSDGALRGLPDEAAGPCWKKAPPSPPRLRTAPVARARREALRLLLPSPTCGRLGGGWSACACAHLAKVTQRRCVGAALPRSLCGAQAGRPSRPARLSRPLSPELLLRAEWREARSSFVPPAPRASCFIVPLPSSCSFSAQPRITDCLPSWQDHRVQNPFSHRTAQNPNPVFESGVQALLA